MAGNIMSWKYYLGITVIASLVLVFLAGFQSVPGYMDAEYYYSMGMRLAEGEGLAEPFIWNYLSPVDSIPHPGFTYWMPGTAFLSALGVWISGLHNFTGAKLIHLLMAAVIPALTMNITWRMTGKRNAAVLAGGLAVFPAFYNIFLGTTDSFGVMMLLGGVFYLAAEGDDSPWKYLCLGGIAGLMHLVRAEGLIWLAGGWYCGMMTAKRKPRAILWVLTGYVAIMAPWFTRNLIVFDGIMPPGTSRTFFLMEYNDLFIYDQDVLTFKRWFSQGWTAIVKTVNTSLVTNIKNTLLVQGQVILTPLIAIGAWGKRRGRSEQAFFLVWICIFLLMSVIFPFAGLRGGFTHSGAAFQTLLWSLAGSGFYTVISWGIDQRGWIEEKAEIVFGSALVLLIAISALYIFHDRVIGPDPASPRWISSYQDAKRISVHLQELGASPEDLIMINNPPGLFAASGRSSIVIPNGDVNVLKEAADFYNAEYLVLERNHPDALNELYNRPDGEGGLQYLDALDQAVFFKLP